MYKNLGFTIKSLARVGFWVALAAAEIGGIIQIVRYFTYYYTSNTELLYTLAGMAAAPGVLWLMSLALYTVGQMVENSDIRTDLAIKQARAMGSAAVPPPQPTYPQPPYQPPYAESPAPAATEEPVPERTVYYPEDYRW